MLFVEVPDLRLYFSEMRGTASVASLWPLGGLVHGSFFPLESTFSRSTTPSNMPSQCPGYVVFRNLRLGHVPTSG